MDCDYYEILGVAHDSEIEDIKKSYRALAKQYHPDKNPGNKKAEEKFQSITEAWDTLSDPQKRAAYDLRGRPLGASPFSAASFSPSPIPKHGVRRGKDINATVLVNPFELLLGKTVRLDYERYLNCNKCDGYGSDLVRCRDCLGLGIIVKEHKRKYDEIIEKQPCETCGGQGYVQEHSCGVCNGFGAKKGQTSVDVSLEQVAEQRTLKLTGMGNIGFYQGTAGDLLVMLKVEYPDREKLTKEARELLLLVEKLIYGSKE